MGNPQNEQACSHQPSSWESFSQEIRIFQFLVDNEPSVNNINHNSWRKGFEEDGWKKTSYKIFHRSSREQSSVKL